MKKQAEDNAKKVEVKDPEIVAQFKITDGREVIIKKAYGYHIEEASKIMGGESKKMFSAVAAQIATFDGKKIVMEEISKLPAKDYTKVINAVQDEVFL